MIKFTWANQTSIGFYRNLPNMFIFSSLYQYQGDMGYIKSSKQAQSLLNYYTDCEFGLLTNCFFVTDKGLPVS